MAHFAELDKNNIVLRVIPGIDENVGDGEKIYSEFSGRVWKRTSYNTYGGVHNGGGNPFRKNYAGIGYFFDQSIAPDGGFVPPSPFPSWVLNKKTCLWEAPIAEPNDGDYYWNEKSLSWVKK